MIRSVEMFAQFTYGPDLSYNDLMEAEASLRHSTTITLQEHAAEFTHFEGRGDTLRVQCIFSEFKESLFHSLCEAIAPLVRDDIEARLLFVDKSLDRLAIYFLSGGEWRESILDIPPAGPIGHRLRSTGLTG